MILEKTLMAIESLYGIGGGLVLALLGFIIVWPAVGDDPLKILARFTISFLIKLFMALFVLIFLSRIWEREYLLSFAMSLILTYLALLALQIVLYVIKIKHLGS
jgi:hypothetical protein